MAARGIKEPGWGRSVDRMTAGVRARATARITREREMTRRARLLALTALFSLGAAAPAFATWVPVTLVPLGANHNIDIVDAARELPNRVDALSFRADNDDVMCRSVDGYFRDGQTVQLFSGMLPMGHEDVIQMLPVHRDLARIDLHCHAAHGGAGDIQIAADVPGGVVVVPAG